MGLITVQLMNNKINQDDEQKLAQQSRRVPGSLQQYALELERSNRELEEFAYVASHDLQEPLRIIDSYLQLLNLNHADQLDQEGQRYIKHTLDAAHRMQELIRDLLAYSRVGTQGQPFAPTNYLEVLEAVSADLQLVIEENSAVITHDDLPIVLADGPQLRQLLQNLIGNALKFHGEQPPHVHLGSRREDKHWLFWVQDNGIGLEPQFADRIFVIFQRLHDRDKYPGTGIGLAICKKIVERHNGRIWVKSQLGQGATFYFTLPVLE